MGFRDDVENGRARRFPKNSSGLPGFIAIDLATHWVAAGQIDPCKSQRARVGDRNVGVHALQKSRMIAGDLVHVPTCGHGFYRPQCLVPSRPDYPFSWRGCLLPGANALSKLIE